MMHLGRRFAVSAVANVEALAEKLTRHTWTLCTGFRLAGYLFLNDSTGGDGNQEYAVIKEPASEEESYVQVESITFSWCDDQQAQDYIFETVSGLYDDDGVALPLLRIEEATDHRCCSLCA